MRCFSHLILLFISLVTLLGVTPSQASEQKPTPVRFLMYNVRNYFVETELDRVPYKIYPKKDSAREAVVDVIADARPDIIGLTEIGGSKALTDLQARLAKRGLHYPHSRVLERRGQSHALAILSRYPIIKDNSKANYGLYGQQKQKMLRGILDVTLKVDDKRRYRILGAHLKARNSNNPSEATSLRRREAETLSHYIASSMKQSKKLPVIVYGDWNDEPADATLRSLTAVAKLHRIEAKDEQGLPWTLYFSKDKKHLILDHIYVNKAMQERLSGDSKSGIVNHHNYRNASDHRAVWCDLH